MVVALLAGTLAFTVARSLTEKATQRVELVAADETGIHPFTPSITDLSAHDVAIVIDGTIDLASIGSTDVAGVESGGLAEADPTLAVLYASSAGTSICDTDALLQALDDDPSARVAWLDLMEIDPDELRSYVATLTPLVLARDTAVSNSRYADGVGIWFQAVLQAGTPVLVDASGAPRVKCSCGNPLAPPSIDTTIAADFTGVRWKGFDPEQIIDITPVEDTLTTIRTIDLSDGELTFAGLGDAVPLDGYLVDESSGVYVFGHDGTRTQILDHPVAAVVDDGMGGIVYQHERHDVALPKRHSAHRHPPDDARRASIWHLAAGAGEPIQLMSSADPADHWFLLQDAGPFASSSVVIYTEFQGPADCDPDWGCRTFAHETVKMFDLESAETTILSDIEGFRSEEVRVGPEAIVASWSMDAESEGGMQWLDHELTLRSDPGGNDWSALVPAEGGRVVALATWEERNLWTCWLDTNADCVPLNLSSYFPDDIDFSDHLAVDGKLAVATAYTRAEGRASASLLIDLDTGSITELGLPGRGRPLRNPLIRSRTRVPPETSPPTTDAIPPETSPPTTQSPTVPTSTSTPAVSVSIDDDPGLIAIAFMEGHVNGLDVSHLATASVLADPWFDKIRGGGGSATLEPDSWHLSAGGTNAAGYTPGCAEVGDQSVMCIVSHIYYPKPLSGDRTTYAMYFDPTRRIVAVESIAG